MKDLGRSLIDAILGISVPKEETQAKWPELKRKLVTRNRHTNQEVLKKPEDLVLIFEGILAQSDAVAGASFDTIRLGKLGIDLKEFPNKGAPLLHKAVEDKKIKAAHALLALGADRFGLNSMGYTVLDVATAYFKRLKTKEDFDKAKSFFIGVLESMCGTLERFPVLQKTEYVINQFKAEDGGTIVHSLIRSCLPNDLNLDQFKELITLLKTYQINLNAKDKEGNNGLHILSKKEFAGYDRNSDDNKIAHLANAAYFLITSGMKHEPNQYGITPLEIATIFNHSGLCKQLKETQAKTKTEFAKSSVIFHYLQKNRQTILTRTQKDMIIEPLPTAINKGYFDIISDWIKADDKNINLQDGAGHTVLHLLADLDIGNNASPSQLYSNIAKNCADYLKKADLSLKNNEGKTALDIAQNVNRAFHKLLLNLPQQSRKPRFLS